MGACVCVYAGLFDEVKAALVCLLGADEDLSRRGRLCLLLSHKHTTHTLPFSLEGHLDMHR